MKYLTVAFLLLFSFPSGSLAGKKSPPLELEYRTETAKDMVFVYFQAMSEINKLKPEEEGTLGDRMAKASGAERVFFTRFEGDTKLVIPCHDPEKVDVPAALAVLAEKFNWKFSKKPE